MSLFGRHGRLCGGNNTQERTYVREEADTVENTFINQSKTKGGYLVLLTAKKMMK